MLTGTEAQVEAAKKVYRVFAARVDDPKSTDYLMDHSTMIYIMDRKGQFLKFYPHTTPGPELARGLVEIMNSEHKAPDRLKAAKV
jgi:cytochrome oxidase Cu insertion factor (SCO1/SenC/PrrC family)